MTVREITNVTLARKPDKFTGYDLAGNYACDVFIRGFALPRIWLIYRFGAVSAAPMPAMNASNGSTCPPAPSTCKRAREAGVMPNSIRKLPHLVHRGVGNAEEWILNRDSLLW